MPARRGEAWNDEDIAVLRAMTREGRPLIEISRRLERSPDAVMARAKRLKLDVRRDVGD